jgi:antitoxin component YwqK of YwqJK toxin-antitoxin module
MKNTFLILISIHFVLFSCNSKIKNKKKQKSENFIISEDLRDTFFYQNGAVKQITSLKLGNKEGFFISFNKNGDTLLCGNYRDNKKEGEWKKYGGDTVIFYKNTNKTEYTISLPANNKQISILLYKNDTLIKKTERIWFVETKQLESETTTYFEKDTICRSIGWYENGVISNIDISINGLSNDTSRSWREDGTLIYEGLDIKGQLIYLKEFDLSGKKVISIKTIDKVDGKLKEKQ